MPNQLSIEPVAKAKMANKIANKMAVPHLPLSFVGYLLIAILGCGSGAQDGDGKPAGSAGVGSGEIFVMAQVRYGIIAEHTIGTIQTPEQRFATYQIYVTDSDGNSLDDATVTLTPQGGSALVVRGGGPGQYYGQLSDLAPAYDLSVVHERGSRTGVKLVSPSNHSVKVPSNPTPNNPITVTWTPNNEPLVHTFVRLGYYAKCCVRPTERCCLDSIHDTFAREVPDSGSLTIPATSASESGFYALSLERSTITDSSDYVYWKSGFSGFVAFGTVLYLTL